jgi:spore coat protein U-like protein
MMGRHFRLALIVCALVAAGSAGAATSTGNLAVTANVVSNCLITTATMDFGTYTPGGGNVIANGEIRVLCTDGMPYEIGLGAGLAPGATETNRSMQNGTALLSYQLFKNPQRTQNWGQTLAADRDIGVGNGMINDNRHRVHGRILDSASNQLVPGGDYTDTVLVTITY